MRYTFNDKMGAHNMSRTEIVTIPDQVYDDQKHFDGKSFPIITESGRKGRGRLMGDEYGLYSYGTGNPVVKVIG